VGFCCVVCLNVADKLPRYEEHILALDPAYSVETYSTGVPNVDFGSSIRKLRLNAADPRWSKTSQGRQAAHATKTRILRSVRPCAQRCAVEIFVPNNVADELPSYENRHPIWMYVSLLD
jgi:hypothetical protein